LLTDYTPYLLKNDNHKLLREVFHFALGTPNRPIVYIYLRRGDNYRTRKEKKDLLNNTIVINEQRISLENEQGYMYKILMY